MGFNKIILPEIDQLKNHLLKVGNEEFIKHWVSRYSKSDAVIGSTESFEFIKQFMSKEYEKDNSIN